MIECRQGELDILFHKYAGAPVAALSVETDQSELTQEDHDLLAKIARSKQGEKFHDLYNGDWKKSYESQSEADLALCCILAFWCKKDSEQMDCIFRQSELYRPKWDERHGQLTYAEMTLQKAIAGTENVYGESQSQQKKTIGTRAVFELVQAGKIKVKSPQWIIRDLIEHDSLDLLFGDPGCGKSFLAIAFALCVATGTFFYGREVKQGPVIYIAGEGHNGLKRRMIAWSIDNMVNHDTAPLFISRMPAALTDADMVDQVQAAIELATAQHGLPVLIIIDTLARNFGPGDENSTKDMSQFVQAADALRASSQATILIVHHSGHSEKGRARGAMALKGALDAEYRLDKDEAGIVRLETTKMKEAKHPEPSAFQFRSVALPIFDIDGEPVYSAVLVPTSYAPPTKRGKAGQGKHQTKAMDLLHNLHKEIRNKHIENKQDPATARVSTEEWKKAMKSNGIPQQRVSEVVGSLRDTGMITERGGYVSLV